VSGKVNFTTEPMEDKQLPINFIHLLWFIKIILKDVISLSKESSVGIKILDQEEDGTKRMVFIIEVDQLPNVYDAIRKNTLFILSSAFAHILKGSFRIEGDKKSTITLKVNYN